MFFKKILSIIIKIYNINNNNNLGHKFYSGNNNGTSFNLTLDNSKNKSILNRNNGIYKIYSNIKITDKNNFIFNFTNILEDLYDNSNNEFTEFRFYFLVKPDINKSINYIKLTNHLKQYSLHIMEIPEMKAKMYKNIGLIQMIAVLVFFSNYDINNLTKISNNIFHNILDSINIINKNVHKNLDNTIINYENKFDVNSEVILIIYADFQIMKQK
jgi:hypothetical protein